MISSDQEHSKASYDESHLSIEGKKNQSISRIMIIEDFSSFERGFKGLLKTCVATCRSVLLVALCRILSHLVAVTRCEECSGGAKAFACTRVITRELGEHHRSTDVIPRI